MAISTDVGFFHILWDFKPFFHAHLEMPVQTGSPLGLKGSFVLSFAGLDLEQNFKKGHEVLNSTWFSWLSIYRYFSKMTYFFLTLVCHKSKKTQGKYVFHIILAMYNIWCPCKSKSSFCGDCRYARLNCYVVSKNLFKIFVVFLLKFQWK